MIGQVLLALSILIILHEWGHFQAARWFGIKVEKFYLFFDAYKIKLFSFKKGDTEYGIGWLPLGGYVKIAGMIDESMDKDFLKEEPKDWEFRAKPAWQRLVVMIGGVTVNIILGIVIYTGIKFVYGETYRPMESVKYGVVAYDLGEDLGLKTGDKILKVNGVVPKRFEDVIAPDVLISDGVLTIERNGQIQDVTVPSDFAEKLKDKGKNGFVAPRVLLEVDTVIAGGAAEKAGLMKDDIIKAVDGQTVLYFDQIIPILGEKAGQTIKIDLDRAGKMLSIQAEVGATKSDSGKIGFAPKVYYETENFGLGQSLVKGAEAAFGTLMINVKALGKVATGKLDATKTVSGPIGIASIFGKVWNWANFWAITGALSMILAFMNMLPIPALDGGHVFFLLIEMVRGKPLSDKALEVAQMVGFVILIALMVFIFGNDIYQLFVD